MKTISTGILELLFDQSVQIFADADDRITEDHFNLAMQVLFQRAQMVAEDQEKYGD